VRNIFRRATKVPAEVTSRAGLARGDSVLAGAEADDGTWLLGTRDALVLVPGRSSERDEEVPLARTTPGAARVIPWESVESADWDRDESRLRVSEVADFGREQPVHVLTVPEPGSLLPMVRERVTASVLLQRRVVVSGRSGLTVIARRPPRGPGGVTWAYDFDAGVDPDDPLVAQAAEEGLRAAQEELGSGEQST
jgi:hypothetical protein